MSKTQTATTQLKSRLKPPEEQLAKKSTTTKPPNGISRTNTQSKLANATSTTSKTSNGIPIKKRTNEVEAKTAIKSKTHSTDENLKTKNPATAIAKPIQKKVATSNVASKSTERTQPLRAKHTTALVEAVKKNAASSSSRKNAPTAAANKPNAVLDSYHSVTVASPPQRRKPLATNATARKEETQASKESKAKLVRRGSRTLEPDEIVVLKRESAKKRIEEQIRTEEENKSKKPVQDAVAFEVNFEETKKARERSKSRAKSDAAQAAAPQEEQADNYSDDFESYESDFETGSSSPNGSSSSETDEAESADSDEISEKVNDDDEEFEHAHNKELNSISSAEEEEQEEDEESEVTQNPITVIQRDNFVEHKFDSGNYEMNSQKQLKLSEMPLQASQQQYDSLDTFSAATIDQLDSGISSYESNGTKTITYHHDEAVFYGGYADFNTKPIFSKRGAELMSKIQLDTLSFTIFDMKPISYDTYMQSYGKLNTTQTTTQTNENRMTIDCQTDDIDMRSMWTQHPPQYDLQTVQKLGAGLNSGATVQNCCGELPQDNLYDCSQPTDEFETSLQALSAFRQNDNSRYVNQHLKGLKKSVDFEKLNSFLLNSAMLMSKVLNSSAKNSKNLERNKATERLGAVSEGYFTLETRFLNALHVIRIFANPKFDLVITVHESLPEADVYSSDFSNLLMVWSTNDRNKPIRLLSTWSEVCRAEICNDSSDIIVCGLRDGSIAMWDLCETYTFCSKLDGHLTHFAATQSIIPTFSNKDEAKKLIDLGAVVDVKSFRTPAKALGLSNSVMGYKSIQFTSLNDTGILTVWTLVETATKQSDFSAQIHHRAKASPNLNSRFEYSSPWARVKLIQSTICDLRDYLEGGMLKAQSQFEKTKSLFQKNIYSDEVLRELNETNADLRQGQSLQGLRFTSMDTGCELIYICMNRNFILACSKSLKSKRFRKIAINDSRFLFPTALRVLTNENFLAVGLSNGSVMILNCNQQKSTTQTKDRAHSSTQRPNTQAHIQHSDAPNNDPDIGKSCAIQNIILNERRSFDNDNNYVAEHYNERPTTAACIAMITNEKKPFELRIYDQQILLSGSVLRKHLVQALDLSSDGWRLFALSNGEVRTYDFYLDRELEHEVSAVDKQKVVDITVARTSSQEQHLLVLNTDNDVVVHLLKQ